MFYSKQPDFKKKMSEVSLQFAIQQEDAQGRLLEKDQCLKAVKRIEEAKIASMDNATRMARSGRIQGHAVPLYLEIDKSKHID